MPELRPPFAPTSVGSWLSGLLQPHPEGYVLARWVLLRGLAVVFFSAFYSFAYQIDGLIGPNGILPANAYLKLVHRYLEAPACYLQVPTLFHWLGARTNALNAVVAVGLALLGAVDAQPGAQADPRALYGVLSVSHQRFPDLRVVPI